MTCSTPRYFSPALLLLAAASLSTGCATVADMGAGMLGPNAVEKVQHRRQSKEIEAVKTAQDVDRAAQMCEQGLDKNELALKPDLRVAACESYAEMMVPAVQQSSCEEFVALQPSLLRFNETAVLNAESDARTSACEKQFAEAKAAAEAEARAEVLAKLQSQGSRDEYGKICADRTYSESLGLDNASREIVCDEFVAMSAEEVAQTDCGVYSQTSVAIYKDVKTRRPGRKHLEQVRDAWLGKAVVCEDWAGIFADMAPTVAYQSTRGAALELLKMTRERDEKFVDVLYSKMSTPDYVVAKLDKNARFNFSYAVSVLGQEDTEVGECKSFGGLLDVLEDTQGKSNVLQVLTDRGCEGYRKQAEKLLVSESAMERKFACRYLAKFGDKGSIKKMRTLSYTDSYESDYTYPVRTACRDAYGKLELELGD